MVNKYTIYTGGDPYYLREPKEPDGLLKEYINNPDLFKRDQADIKNHIAELKKESDENLLNAVQFEKERDDLIKFLKKEVGVNNLDEVRNLLKGRKLKDELNRLRKARN